MKKWMAAVACACILCGIIGCTNTDAGQENHNVISEQKVTEAPSPTVQAMETVNLMQGVEAEAFMHDVLPIIPITKFGVPLFQNAVKAAENGENVLISPLSAWTALCMTELGAAGETREQMEQVLSIPIEIICLI